MKTQSKIQLIFKNLRSVLPIIGLILVGCEESNSGDTTPPGELTVVSTTPTNGGGIITYDLPQDDDILFVRADYTNAQGEDVFRVSSKSNNHIEISGMVEAEPVEISLRVVDENENESNSVIVSLTPERSFIYEILENISLVEDLGGVRVYWENQVEKTVFIYFYIEVDGEEEVRILSSSLKTNSQFIRGLAAVSTNISVKVEDFDGNSTSILDLGEFTPLFEEKIDKSTWSLVGNLSINGNAYEGRTVNFWDDVVDTAATNSDNSYFIINRSDNGGVLRWPLDIVIDLNKTVKINRFKVWQRAYWYNGPDATTPYYYQEENLREFDLFVSNDKIEWELLGSFDIGDPKNSDGEIPAEKIEEAASGHDFNLDEISPNFRYLKFSIQSNYGSDSFTHGSEISIFGRDNL